MPIKKKLSELFSMVLESFDSEIPFVMYRKPVDDRVFLWIQEDSQIHYIEQFDTSGFVMAPFDLQSQKAVIFPLEMSDRFVALMESNDLPRTGNGKDHKTDKPEEKQKHIDLVSLAVQDIRSGHTDKVVLSRKERVSVQKANPLKWFKSLLMNYPGAFAYWWYHPEVGMWMGASPETLLRSEGKKFFTMALAGTQAYRGTTDVVWGEKEKEEQKLVTDYIIRTLRGVSLKLSKTHTKRAGNLLHICTEIEGELGSIDVGAFLSKLHPTPAVCGRPFLAAKDFILKNESYDREFYTGFLGELNINSGKTTTSDLYVNLRCMQIYPINKEVAIYVGGGITSDSDPAKEWQETVFKSLTIRSILEV